MMTEYSPEDSSQNTLPEYSPEYSSRVDHSFVSLVLKKLTNLIYVMLLISSVA